jgi:hypothetical protein
MPIGIGSTYYDDKGNMVMGGIFYPPKVVNNQVTVPGGLFVGTNLSNFIENPQSRLASVPAEQMLREFGTEKVTVGKKQLRAEYFAFDATTGKTRSVGIMEMIAAQQYLSELQKAAAEQKSFQLRAK